MVDENSNDKNDLLLGSDFNKKIINKLEKIKNRYDEINKKLETPENYKNHKLLEKLNKEKTQLQKPNDLFEQYKTILKQINDSKDIINNNKKTIKYEKNSCCDWLKWSYWKFNI